VAQTVSEIAYRLALGRTPGACSEFLRPIRLPPEVTVLRHFSHASAAAAAAVATASRAVVMGGAQNFVRGTQETKVCRKL